MGQILSILSLSSLTMTIFRPIKPNLITQLFGENKVSFYKELNMNGHNGVDFYAPMGTPVYWNGSKRGKVLSVINDATYGKYIEIIVEEEPEINKYIFAHLSKFNCQAGDVLESGQLFCYTGNTGKYTTGPHLHFGMKKVAKNRYGNYYTTNRDNGYKGAIDPMSYYKNIYVKDHIAILNAQIPIFERVIGFVKALISLRIQLNIKRKKK